MKVLSLLGVEMEGPGQGAVLVGFAGFRIDSALEKHAICLKGSASSDPPHSIYEIGGFAQIYVEGTGR